MKTMTLAGDIEQREGAKSKGQGARGRVIWKKIYGWG